MNETQRPAPPMFDGAVGDGDECAFCRYRSPARTLSAAAIVANCAPEELRRLSSALRRADLLHERRNGFTGRTA